VWEIGNFGNWLGFISKHPKELKNFRKKSYCSGTIYNVKVQGMGAWPILS